jgi:hypothetical protein
MDTLSGAGSRQGMKDAKKEKPQDQVPVLLTVTGKQTDPEGSTRETSAVYSAVCRTSEQGLLFSYPAEDTLVTLFLSRRLAWMQRGGSIEARMVFDPSGAVTRCDYETAYGIIPMEVRTEGISILAGGPGKRGEGGRDVIGRGLQARIRYALIMGADYQLSCSVTIKAQQM